MSDWPQVLTQVEVRKEMTASELGADSSNTRYVTPEKRERNSSCADEDDTTGDSGSATTVSCE